MNRQMIMELIRDFETRKLPELIRREVIVRIPTANKAIAFIGPRRSGKTFLCYDLIAGLLKEGVPRELYYLAMVESGFNNRAYSRVSATGTWQFMKGTAKLYGVLPPSIASFHPYWSVLIGSRTQ